MYYIMTKTRNESTKTNITAISQIVILLKGKWRLAIIHALSLQSNYRFGDLLTDIEGIGSKMLTADLKFLEQNDIITRNIISTSPILIAYSLTEYGQSLNFLLHEMSEWGEKHLTRQEKKSTNNEMNHLLTITI